MKKSIPADYRTQQEWNAFQVLNEPFSWSFRQPSLIRFSLNRMIQLSIYPRLDDYSIKAYGEGVIRFGNNSVHLQLSDDVQPKKVEVALVQYKPIVWKGCKPFPESVKMLITSFIPKVAFHETLYYRFYNGKVVSSKNKEDIPTGVDPLLHMW